MHKARLDISIIPLGLQMSGYEFEIVSKSPPVSPTVRPVVKMTSVKMFSTMHPSHKV